MRSITGAVGVLQFGNNGENYVLIGNTATSANTYLSFRINSTTESTASGTEAFRITSTGVGNSSTNFYGAATFSSSVNIGASATTGKQLIVNQTGASGYFLSGEEVELK